MKTIGLVLFWIFVISCVTYFLGKIGIAIVILFAIACIVASSRALRPARRLQHSKYIATILSLLNQHGELTVKKLHSEANSKVNAQFSLDYFRSVMDLLQEKSLVEGNGRAKGFSLDLPFGPSHPLHRRYRLTEVGKSDLRYQPSGLEVLKLTSHLKFSLGLAWTW